MMANGNDGEKKGNLREGYIPFKKGYQPAGDGVTGGHKPEKSELKPKNPPKKR